VSHNSGDGIFGVRLNRTADQARRLQAVIASHGKVEPLGVGIESALDLANSPPIDTSWISVLLIASDHTALATDALGHIEMKSVLLAGLKGTLRNQKRRAQRRDVIQAIRCRCGYSQKEGKAVFPRPLDQWQCWSQSQESRRYIQS
jgi:hypothetical protein